MFAQIFEKVNSFLSGVPFDALVTFVWGSYAAVFTLAAILSLLFKKFKKATKRPFLCFTNAYAGVTLALFLKEFSFAEAVTAASVFWVAGYVLYGLLCALSSEGKPVAQPAMRVSGVAALPTPAPVVNSAKAAEVRAPAAKNNVRLEHAVAVTDKLLSKNLSKSDRQELEKLKNTLAVLQIKGTLTPTEAEILNDNFNALLKLMAKYNV